jgi:hypothetical protein
MKECIRNADVIHMCVATNVPASSNRVAQDTAETLVAALQELREELASIYVAPTILILRSGSLSDEYNKAVPAPVHAFLMYALHSALLLDGLEDPLDYAKHYPLAQTSATRSN